MIMYGFLLFIAGVCTWSFSEYALHDWVGHGGKGKNKFSREHLTHHARKEYFTPTLEKCIVSLSVLLPLGVGISLLTSLFSGLSYTLGLGLGYFSYEVMHRRVHTHGPWNFYGRWARKHHFYHHFGDAKKNHGVTSPIWDLVFGTYRTPGVLEIPEKMAMRWLLDPETGDVKKEYAHDYVLKNRKETAPEAVSKEVSV